MTPEIPRSTAAAPLAGDDGLPPIHRLQLDPNGIPSAGPARQQATGGAYGWPPSGRDVIEPAGAQPSSPAPRSPPAEAATDDRQALEAWAVVVVQKNFRGWHCRRGEALRATARQRWLCERHPGLAAEIAPLVEPGLRRLLRAPRRAAARPASGEAEAGAAAPPMHADERVAHLKSSYSALWEHTLANVDATHPTYLQREGSGGRSEASRRGLLRAVRDELFVRALPEDACAQSGFFSEGQHQISLRNRKFFAPAADIEMRPDLPASKRKRS